MYIQYFVCTFIDSYRSRIMVRIVSIQSWDYKKRPIEIWIMTLLIISSPDLYLLSYSKFPELFQIISTIMSRGEKEESFWIYIRLIEIELRSGFWKVFFWVKTNTNLENIWTLKNIIHLPPFKQEGVLYFYFIVKLRVLSNVLVNSWISLRKVKRGPWDRVCNGLAHH